MLPATLVTERDLHFRESGGVEDLLIFRWVEAGMSDALTVDPPQRLTGHLTDREQHRPTRIEMLAETAHRRTLFVRGQVEEHVPTENPVESGRQRQLPHIHDDPGRFDGARARDLNHLRRRNDARELESRLNRIP